MIINEPNGGSGISAVKLWNTYGYVGGTLYYGANMNQVELGSLEMDGHMDESTALRINNPFPVRLMGTYFTELSITVSDGALCLGFTGGQ